MTDRAATVIPLPLSVVESNIWDVTAWPAFLSDVRWVQRAGHERYLFGVRQGRRLHEIPVAVRWHARDHRVTWQELDGPTWRGEIRLTAMNGRRTRATMTLNSQPRSITAKLAELFGVRRREASGDLGRLADRLASIPQPFNPGRLVTGRPVAGRRAIGERSQAAARPGSGRPTVETGFESVGAGPA
jgi:hypothetical protein